MSDGEARLLLGAPIAAEIRASVREDITRFVEQQGFAPTLAVVLVGRDAPSAVYLRQILRACEAAGIGGRLVEIEGSGADEVGLEARVTAAIRALNDDPFVAGIIVQMPLPPEVRLRAVIDAIDPAKDIDGIHPVNAGLLRLGFEGFLPATAHAAIEMLHRYDIPIEGREAVVIGRSNVVGMPVAFMLVREHATVTVCHSRTRDLAAEVARAEILVVAAGRPGLIQGSMLRPGVVVVDVGINVVGDAIVGDVDMASARLVASAITPVPGGVGPVTNALLLTHLVRAAVTQAATRQAQESTRMSFPSDLEIARSVTPRRIIDVAAELGLTEDDLELYGPLKAKVRLSAIERVEAANPRGKYILVSAITPTPLGEGKTTTTVGLAQGLNRIGKRAAVAIRQPSLGPVFGIKGGAAGGGYSQVIPMEDFNLHLTGDVHAIGAAHNLAAAFIDNSLHHKNPHGIDPLSITWPRVIDISDRAVRKMVIGLGGRENGVPRETETVITVASEVMAILALARDLKDLRVRLGRVVLAQTADGKPVTADDLKVAGAMTALLLDAIKPNLLQTLEGGPAFVHCGPFANIAHGNNSILADRLALATNDAVCTEAGFGADMGAEKFFDIKCRASGLRPDAAVVVATIRALKMHGGVGKIVAGKPLDAALLEENVDAVRRGARTWPSRSRTSGSTTFPWSSRSTRSRPTRRRRSPPSSRSRWRPGRERPWSPPISSTAAWARRPSPTRSGPPPRRGPPTSSSSTRTTRRCARRSSRSQPGSTVPRESSTSPLPPRRSRPTRSSGSGSCPCAWPRRSIR